MTPESLAENWRQEQQFAQLADFQDYLVRRYAPQLADHRERDHFRRHIIQLVHMVYREAQEPLVKQLTDFVVHYNRPLVMDVPK